MRMLSAIGAMNRLAADPPLELGIAGLAEETRTFAQPHEVGQVRRDGHGADVLILGCAGTTGLSTTLVTGCKSDLKERPRASLGPLSLVGPISPGRVIGV
jgi:hypothetical protein